MRELVVEGQEVIIIPRDFNYVNKGTVTGVRAGDFTVELKYKPEGIMVKNYCEFYTQTKHGKLSFDSYATEISGKTLVIASPAKHKFLQRRQYTRIKYVNDFNITCEGKIFKITTLDISAGGMKFKTNENIDINGNYNIDIPVSDSKVINCIFNPIRIEKLTQGGYNISGQFSYKNGRDKMLLTHYCARRNVEIKNK